ncbi:MAG: DNA polymerase I [Lachnospiraceae bacterium]|nr:DNA polymerase I [Lachnospiraceae bacterium]
MSDEYLLIIDGSSLLSTQFYGNLPPAVLMAKTNEEKERYFPKIMQTSGGVYTNGIFGFFRYLLKVLRQQKPTHIAVAWDITRDTFRRRMYADYKANRSETIVPLRDQFALCQDILKRIGVKQFCSSEFEADDYSGSLSTKFSAQIPVRILTKDRDYLQLADENTTIWLLQQAQKKADELFNKYGIRKEAPKVAEKAFPMTPERIEQEYGVAPSSVAELKGLEGDTSDNIKGVPGIGGKTALALIAHYKTIDALYDAIHAAGPQGEKELAGYFKTELGITKNPIGTLTKTEEGAIVGEEAARLSRDLATIRRDIPIEETLADLAVNVNYAELARVFEELEIKTIPLPEAAATERKEFAVIKVESAETATKMSEIAACKSPVGIHRYEREADAQDWEYAFGLAGKEISVVIAQNETRCVFTCKEDCAEELFSQVSKLAADHDIYCFEAKEKWCECLPRDAKVYDISVLDYLLRPLADSHTAEALCIEWRGASAGDAISSETVAELALTLGTELVSKVKEAGMESLYLDIEMPLLWVLHDMEAEGVTVDSDALGAFAAYLKQEISKLTRSIYEQCGTEFNINSPKQLGDVLFEQMKIPYPVKGKKGYSTSADVLEKLKGNYPVIDDILAFRQFSKLYSTYAEGLTTYIHADGRIHTTFRQTVTATGRLSSTDPNLQNIPARTELGRDIRKAFVPRPGYVFVDADYSQIELRLMAHLSGDESLQKAYLSAADIHRLTASQVFGVPFDEVTGAQRSAAKAVNFGILYGIGSFSLSQDLGITRATAEAYIQNYFARFPGVKEYLDRTVAEAKKNGSVRTMYGRLRPIPELSSNEFAKRAFGERVAMNSPIQGTAADIMKLAMLAADRAIRSKNLKAKILLQVHDELLIEAPEDEAEIVASCVKEAMEGAVKLSVPLTAEVHCGANWFEAK